MATAMKAPFATIKCMVMVFIGPRTDAFPLDNGKTIEKAVFLQKLIIKVEVRRWSGTWGKSSGLWARLTPTSGKRSTVLTARPQVVGSDLIFSELFDIGAL
jgi:hypothetical protein